MPFTQQGDKMAYGRGRPKKGEVRPAKVKSGRGPGGPQGPRPAIWKSGPYDEYRHSMYHPYLLSRAQANFRKEEFTLTFDEYYDMWKDDWNNRGRKPDNMCMTRRDPDGPWSKENTYVLSRREHLQIQGYMRKGTRYNKPTSYKKLKV